MRRLWIVSSYSHTPEKYIEGHALRFTFWVPFYFFILFYSIIIYQAHDYVSMPLPNKMLEQKMQRKKLNCSNFVKLVG